MTDKTVLVTDFTWPAPDIEVAVLKEVNAKLLLAPSSDESTLIELVAQADAILTCFAHVTESVIRAGNKLQVIGRYGIGVDNIDVSTATSLEIPVTYVPAYCVDEVAEHTLGFVLSLARKISLYDHAVRQGSWNLQDGLPIHRVRGKTLGLIGFGRIGQVVAQKAAGFGMNVTFYDPDASVKNVVDKELANEVSLNKLITESDFISLHAPLTESTRTLVNADFMHAMKSSACLVNCARGGLIDHDALLIALREGHIAGAALDVFEPEQLTPDHPLLQLGNLIATPHVAFYSAESVEELQRRASMNVAAILDERLPEAIINPEVLERPRWRHLVGSMG